MFYHISWNFLGKMMGFISPTCSLIHITHDMIMTWWRPYCIRRISLFKPQVPMWKWLGNAHSGSYQPHENVHYYAVYGSLGALSSSSHTHTHTHTGQTFTKRQPIFPSGNLTSAQKSVGSSQMISSSNSCRFNIPGFEGNYLTAWSIYIYKFIKCWSSSISPSIFFPLQTRL